MPGLVGLVSPAEGDGFGETVCDVAAFQRSKLPARCQGEYLLLDELGAEEWFSGNTVGHERNGRIKTLKTTPGVQVDTAEGTLVLVKVAPLFGRLPQGHFRSSEAALENINHPVV